MLFVNVVRASAFVMYQVDRCHFYSSWYFLYFPHQELPVVAAWEMSSNAIKDIIAENSVSTVENKNWLEKCPYFSNDIQPVEEIGLYHCIPPLNPLRETDV